MTSTEDVERHMQIALRLHEAFLEKLHVQAPELVDEFLAMMRAHHAVTAGLATGALGAAAAAALFGERGTPGKLPVSLSQFPFGHGLDPVGDARLKAER